jgi:tetratricopeptide (TPR) repeat protein
MMLLLAAAVFIGNQACRPCHAAIVDAYAKTPMARSSGRVDSIRPAEFTAAGHRYRIANNRLEFGQSAVPFHYFIGSNTSGRSYLFERDGYLFELPVTWYQKKQIWDASPGYENYAEVRLDRPIDPTCLACHASGVRPVLGTQNRYGAPPFSEDGISCERCHGPASEHIRNPVKVPMVNPSKLAPERRDAICAQCHLTGEARIERAGRRLAEYRAGDRLADFVTYLVWNSPAGDFKVTSHVEKLALSKCKQSTGDALWCGSCHDTHTNTDKTQTACLSCHVDSHHREDRCATCHMPKTAAADVGHGVLTDHSIPRIVKSVPVQPRRELIAFGGTADDRSLGLAYAELHDPRAREYLRRAKSADPEVLLRLATLEPDPAKAVSLYQSVLRLNPSQPSALVNLGALYATGGRTVEAAALWERALKTNPAIEGAVLNLAQIRPPVEARRILQNYLEFNPGSRAVRKRLSDLR